MTRRPLRALLAVVAALFLTFGASALPASAARSDTSDFSFESFDGQYYLDVDADGHATTRVVETLVAVFPDFDQNRGIIRAIPLMYGEVPLRLTMLSVTDGEGDPVYYERDDYDGFAEFALGTDDFVHGRTTYVLEYTISDTIRHFADSGGDEFYWDINGDGWAQSFGKVSATVHVSDALTNSLTGQAACYLRYTEEGSCQLERDGDAYSVAVSPVGPYNTLTVAIGFEGGTVVQPELPRDSWIIQVVPKVVLGIGLLLLLGAIAVRLFLWRDARGRGTIIAQYDPPEDSDLLLDANIVGRESSGLSAQLIDFAVRRIINVIDTKPGTPVGTDKTRFSVELLTQQGATPRELKVLVLIFGASLREGKTVSIGHLGPTTGAALYALTGTAASFALSSGLRAQPSATLQKVFLRIGIWLVPAIIPSWVWASFHGVLDENVVWPAFGALACTIILPIILSRPRLLTEKGAELRDYLLGMREYLTIAEEDRLRVLQSPQGAQRIIRDPDAIVKLNERLLSYAVLWGVEDQWAEKLRAEAPAEVPDWFSGSSFNSAMLRGFTSESNTVARPIVTSSSGSSSSWSSSGSSSFSSGSSGGGFSGGGGGGGGGGGR